ncbi:MAG: hypothetical protein LQ337_001202 [Flavoplaca oasis]|nr:MAG: hypothetical protein LQ337_001202 [Flavoplaca oasis]
MCWPRLEGGLEIEERYPRTNDPREPRRRRLNFVRSSSRSRRNSSSSDDYALMHSSFYNARPIRAEMRERHDPHILQQQDHAIRQLHGQNQQMQHQLQWQEEMRRRQQIEQAHQQQQQMLQHGHGHPPPPPMIHQHPQHHDGFPPGIEPVHEEFHPQPHIKEIAPRPRSRMPDHLQHGGKSPTRGRSHRLLTGQCHCGSIRYTSTSRPLNLTYCYCTTCRRLSGSPFIPWTDIPSSSFHLQNNSGLKTLNSDIAERTICRECGSSITMKYQCDEATIGIAAGTIDEGNLHGNEMKATEHIFVEQKAAWHQMAEDGVKRWGRFSDMFEEKLRDWRAKGS